MIKVGVVGFGLAANVFHLPFIQLNQAFKLVAICSSKHNEIRQHYPSVTLFTDAASMIEQTEAELIVVCSPNVTHVPLAIKALSQNKSVIIEKPVALTLAELNSLEQAQQASTGQVFGYHNRRWDGDFLTVKALINSNHLGQVRVFESRFSRFRPTVSSKWKEAAGTSTGLWNDLGPHLIDQSLQLFGSPHAITARILAQRNNAVADDYFHVQLHYDQLEVRLVGSNFDNSPHARFHIEGDAGSFVKYGKDPQESAILTGADVTDESTGQETEKLWGMLYTSAETQSIPTAKGNYGALYDAVAKSLVHGDDFPITLEQLYSVTKLLELARTSASMGKTVTVRKYRN